MTNDLTKLTNGRHNLERILSKQIVCPSKGREGYDSFMPPISKPKFVRVSHKKNLGEEIALKTLTTNIRMCMSIRLVITMVGKGILHITRKTYESDSV